MQPFYALSASFFVIAIVFHTYQKSVIESIRTLSLGNAHACVVFDDKRMKCWGVSVGLGLGPWSVHNDLGDDLDEINSFLPYFSLGINTTILDVTCGGFHTCALLNETGVKCFGMNTFGQAGLETGADPIGFVTNYFGDRLPYVNLGTMEHVRYIASGNQHTCILFASGNIKCFGLGSYGQLGNEQVADVGRLKNQMGEHLPFINIGTNLKVNSLHISSTAHHACVIVSKTPFGVSHRMKCWGRNDDYQLGYGDNNHRGDNKNEMGDNLPFVDLGSESRVIHISTSITHTCVQLINLQVKCYGKGSHGELGHGSKSSINDISSNAPSIPVESGQYIVKISTGTFLTCILLKDHLSVKCFGVNEFGQLGQGDGKSRGDSPLSTPDKIPAIQLGTGSLKIHSIHSGSEFNCIWFVDQTVKCFGNGSRGQLVRGSSANIGLVPDDMGQNLMFAQFYDTPTQCKPVEQEQMSIT